MKNKRIIRGNFTTIPTGADVISVYETNAVTERSESSLFPGKDKAPSIESVIEARLFSSENQK